jgi:hypothetical protein
MGAMRAAALRRDNVPRAAGETGAGSGSLSIAPNLTSTNRDQISTPNRSHGLTVNWSGAHSELTVAVAGGDLGIPTNSMALFYCSAPVGANNGETVIFQ